MFCPYVEEKWRGRPSETVVKPVPCVHEGREIERGRAGETETETEIETD